MIKKQVSAKVPGKDGSPDLGPVTIEVNYAENLEEAKQMYGEEAVLSNAFANWKVTLQANIRNCLKQGMTQEEIQEKLKDVKMGVSLPRGSRTVDPEAAWLAKYQSATPEERKRMREELERKAAMIG